MSVSKHNQTRKVQTPSDEKLHRLTRAAGSYLGLRTSEPLPTEEVVAQGEANGYDESEVRALLTREGYASAEFIPVPPQGDAFGELWHVPEPMSEPVREKEDGTLQQFRDWCKERASSSLHSYTRQSANRKYARAKDVDRSFVQEYNEFSTVLITYCRQREGESLAEHAKNFYSRQITQKRRRILKREGIYEQMAGVSILAPRVPSPNALTTHAHDFLWLPSHVEPELFDSLQEIEGFDIEISVENHISSEVKTPESVKARGSDSPRGDTTALPQELGANLPMLTCRFDARGAPDYVEKWASAMREGTDGSFSTAGVRRFRKLKTFEERADLWKVRRKVQQAHSRAENLCQNIEYHTGSPSPQDHSSPDSYDSTEGEGGSCLPEGKGEGDTDHPTESRFTFTDTSEPDERKFTFTKHG